jgi:hypothetical protein
MPLYPSRHQEVIYMREHGRNQNRLGAGQEARERGMPPAPGLTIEPPPKESGPERLYRVVYVIDINAMNPKQAAERAYEIMKDPQSIRPVLDIIDSSGRQTRVDLSDE